MKQLYIEPRQIGKSLKIKSLYDLHSNNGGCLIMVPKLKFMERELFKDIPKKNIVTNEEKMISRKEKTLLIDEYFLLSNKQKEFLNINLFKFENIFAFSTADDYYPKDLIKLIRENKRITSFGLILYYLDQYPTLSEYKFDIMNYIKDLDLNLLTNPSFELINTKINQDSTIYKKYMNGHPFESGNFLIDDSIFWIKKLNITETKINIL